MTQRDIEKFQKIIMQTMARIAQETGKAGQDTLDEILCQRTTTLPTSEAAVEELQAVLDHACRTLFRQTGTINRELRHKSVPWWTTRLTTQRRVVNAERRQYQRTKGNDELCRQKKEKYLAAKAEYAAAIRQEKSKSWKEYCNATSSANPWNAVYKMAAGKTERATHTTTLRQPDGSLATDIPSTALLMIQKFAPEDNQGDDSETHW